MIINQECGSKMRRLKATKPCFIAAAVLVFLFIRYHINSKPTESYKQSEAIINLHLAKHLEKDPNELTLQDLMTQKNAVFIGNEATNLNPLLKRKNLEWILFYGYEDIDLSPLSKLEKLNSLEINFATIIPKKTKNKWYDKLFSTLRISRPYNSKLEPFNLGRLKKLDNLEKLILKKYESVYNIEALASLKNLEYLTLQPSRNKIKAVLVINGVPEKPLADYANEPLDFSPLQNLNKLTYLNLLGVKAKDFSFIKKLTNLKHLYLGSTNISDEQKKELQNAFPELEITIR